MRRFKIGTAIVLISGLSFIGCGNPAMNSAKVYLRNNELEQAKKQLVLAIQGNPENSEAHYLLGKLYLDEGDYDKMNEHYALSLKFSDEKKSAIEVDRFTTFSRIYSIGVEHFLKGDEETDEAKKKEAYEKAIVEMGNAYKVDKDIRALEGMALSHYGLSNDEEAERLFKLVLEEDPQNKNSLVQMGNFNFNKAEQERINSDGVNQKVKDYFDEALNYYNKYLEFYPDETENVLLQMAFSYEQLDQNEKAVVLYQQVVDNEPENIEMIIRLGVIKFELGDDEEALNLFQEALKTKPDDVDLLKGVAYPLWNKLIPKVNAGDTLTAAEINTVLPYMEKVVKLDDQDLTAWEALFRLYAQLDQFGKDPDAAEKMKAAYQKYTDLLKIKG